MEKQRAPMVHIPTATLHIPGRQVVPGGHEKNLRCRCGSMKFRVFVVPAPEHGMRWARANAIVCTNAKCQRVIGVTPEAFLDIEGETLSVSKKEQLRDEPKS